MKSGSAEHQPLVVYQERVKTFAGFCCSYSTCMHAGCEMLHLQRGNTIRQVVAFADGIMTGSFVCSLVMCVCRLCVRGDNVCVVVNYWLLQKE